MTGLKIVIVNGAPGSGKTSFENFCQEIMDDYCQMRSTVDLVKEIAFFYTG
jgi:chloramphenicol 3-O-phosphotransferase